MNRIIRSQRLKYFNPRELAWRHWGTSLVTSVRTLTVVPPKYQVKSLTIEEERLTYFH